MTKRKSVQMKTAVAESKSRDGGGGADLFSSYVPTPAAIRETIESVVVAFILAFLFRTFEAEAFVIPTGSMAPTLMGRHKDLFCPKCGCEYQSSASEEVNIDGSLKPEQHRTISGTCPMCRYTAYLGPDNPQHTTYPSYNGDRILVAKFAYELAEPKRWDVVVFKFPGDNTGTDARTNFIKRLIGLPGETVRIQHGDIWTKRGEEEFKIARKQPEKLLAMLQPVFDNDYMARISRDGWPARWKSEAGEDGGGAGWSVENQTEFRSDGAAGQRWLRYRHLTPTHQQWAAVDRGATISAGQIAPQYIRDFTAYNTNRTQGSGSIVPETDSLGMYWVGDLVFQCTAELESNEGELLFELRKGGRKFSCRFDVSTGQATLGVSGRDMTHFQPTAKTAVQGPGRHEIRFSNCDEELLLWVDGRVVKFDSTTSYKDLDNNMPDDTDLSPVGIASKGAKVKVNHLAIFRDLFYIADLPYGDQRRYAAADPRLFAGEVGAGTTLRNRREAKADFVLKEDQFFMLGDNSARSKDGRLWGANNYWVPRELLIGKALFIYWPHSWDRTPYINLYCPYFPNFSQMGLVR